MIKALLTSDLDIGNERKEVQVPAQERMLTFKRVLKVAEEHDILLIAGNIFDCFLPDPAVIEETFQLISDLRKKGTTIVAVPGKNEVKGSQTSEALFKINLTYLFAGIDFKKPFKFTKDDESLFIYGTPYYDSTNIFSIPKTEETGFHMGLFHTASRNTENDYIMTFFKGGSRSFLLDFYALGHESSSKIYKFGSKIVAAYAGSPEPVSYENSKDRYTLSLEIENNEITNLKRLTVGKYRAEKIEADCRDFSSAEELIAHAKERGGDNVFGRLVTSGERKFILTRNIIDRIASSYYKLEVIDSSLTPIDLIVSQHANEDSPRGEFLSLIKESLDSGAFPADVDLKALSHILDRLMNNNTDITEGWLCELINA